MLKAVKLVLLSIVIVAVLVTLSGTLFPKSVKSLLLNRAQISAEVTWEDVFFVRRAIERKDHDKFRMIKRSFDGTEKLEVFMLSNYFAFVRTNGAWVLAEKSWYDM